MSYKPTAKEKRDSFDKCISYLQTGIMPKDLDEDSRIYFMGDLLEKVIAYNTRHKACKRHYISFDTVVNPETLFEYYIVKVLRLYATTHVWDYTFYGWQEYALRGAIIKAFKTLNSTWCGTFMDGDIRISIPWETANHVKQLYKEIELAAKDGVEFISFCIGEEIKWSTLQPYVKPLIIELTSVIKEEGYVGRMLTPQLEQLQRIRKGLTDLILDGRCKMFLGLAGSGKSTAACRGLTGGWLGISLCNTVALELHNKNNNITPLSITAYRCYTKCGGAAARAICSTPNIIIDETSLWTANELDVLVAIIEQVQRGDGELYILGDTHQQHGFLGRGCLLDAITKLAKEVDETCISNHTTLHRQMYMPEHKERLERFIETGEMHNFKETFNELDYDKIATAVISDCRTSVAIAFTNNSVEQINRLCITKLANCTADETKAVMRMNKKGFKEWLSCNIWRLRGYDIPLLGAKTQLLGRPPKNCSIIDRLHYKILRNEKAVLHHGAVTRQITGETMSADGAFDLFDLGFAITCFRSQGLEWRNTHIIIETPMLLSYESVYVAESRCLFSVATYTRAEYLNRTLQPIHMLNAFDVSNHTL